MKRCILRVIHGQDTRTTFTEQTRPDHHLIEPSLDVSICASSFAP